MTTPGTQPVNTQPNPMEVNNFHRYSDVDNNPTAQHHTLGRDPEQASPGSHTHDGVDSVTVNAKNAETFDNKPPSFWMPRQQISQVNDIDPLSGSLGDGATGGTCNRYLSSGMYNGLNLIGAPVGGWVYIEVMAHINGAHWQRQRCYDMNGVDNLSIWERTCIGGDPTVSSSWTPWYPVSGSVCFGSIYRTTNFNGLVNARYQIDMTNHTDAQDVSYEGRRYRAFTWLGGSYLYCNFKGYYNFTAHMHGNSTVSGAYQHEINRMLVGGGEETLAVVYTTGQNGGSHMLSVVGAMLNAGDIVRLVQTDPVGITYSHYGLGPTLKGQYVGPR